MILLFLGSWRSTLIVARLDSAVDPVVDHRCCVALGHSLNVMTLGGLALAVGILVDDATVEIENIHRNLGHGQAAAPGDSRRRAADRGAGVRLDADDLHRVRVGGVPRRPAEVPVHAAGAGGGLRDAGLLPAVAHARADDGALPAPGSEAAHAHAAARTPRAFSLASPSGVQPRFEQFREATSALPRLALAHRRVHGRGCFAGVRVRARWRLLPFVGQDFFPTVDAGQFRLHVRAPAGTRIEETERYFGQVEEEIRDIVPENEVEP